MTWGRLWKLYVRLNGVPDNYPANDERKRFLVYRTATFVVLLMLLIWVYIK